jgi:hypothetical protein
VPALPALVAAHWRRELQRLGVALSFEPATDSRDTPSA